MKIQSVLKKTALATALAAVVAGASFSAVAGTFVVGTPTIAAVEMFGDESQNTTLALPLMEFTANSALKDSVAGESTIKLTLGEKVVFGENYDNPVNWPTQGIAVLVDGNPIPGASVLAGGTNNDNQITIQFGTDGVVLAGKEITLEGFKVKNLKDYLAKGTAQELEVALEVRATGSDATPENFDTDKAAVALKSIDAFWLNASLSTKSKFKRVDISAIDSDKARKVFTNDLANGIPGTVGAITQNFIDFGTLTIARNTKDKDNNTVTVAQKEGNKDFDVSGADDVSLTITGSNTFSGYGSMYLVKGIESCATGSRLAAVPPADMDSKVVGFNFKGDILAIGQPARLCAEATGNKEIAPQEKITAAGKIEYFSKRYVPSMLNTVELGDVNLESGTCQVTLFNLPNVNAADNAFIRFTNTSKVAGSVKASVWSQDGVKLDEREEVLSNLAGHATAVFHTNPAQTTGTYLGTVLPKFAESGGRSRIVLEGQFENCEALGLIRTPNGTLTNMTSTVYSGGSNGTSNTED